MNLEVYVNELRVRLREALPGIDAQKRMAPAGRFRGHYHPHPPGARRSAVLLALFGDSDGVCLPLIERPVDSTVHSGQVSFPGGAHESDEPFPEATALREAHEEIGIPPDSVQILGRLTPLYIGPSNFTVHPVVGFRAKPSGFQPNPLEVRRVVVAEVAGLDDSATEADVEVPPGRSRHVPCFLLQGAIVWGATAMILSEFLEVHRAAMSAITGSERGTYKLEDMQ